MKRHICPRCGSSNIDWIIPQVWSRWSCKDCDYTGPAIEGDDDLANEIKEDWEKNKEKYLKEERKRAEKLINGESEKESEEDSEDDLSEEELERKLEELNI